MKKNGKKSNYATVSNDEGVNYREISDMMTEIGFKMNHSSARNYVLRVMRKFVEALVDKWDLEVEPDKIDVIAKSPQFQQAIYEVLQQIETQKNDR